jgi:hypothetical protein
LRIMQIAKTQVFVKSRKHRAVAQNICARHGVKKGSGSATQRPDPLLQHAHRVHKADIGLIG